MRETATPYLAVMQAGFRRDSLTESQGMTIRKPMMLALSGVALIAAIAALQFAPIAVNASAPAYMTAAITRGNVEVTVMAEGTLKPQNLVAVGAQVSGRITRLAVKLGDRVQQGDLIAEIDSVTQQNDLRTAQAALANITAQRAEKQAVLALAEKNLTRQKALVRTNVSTRSDFDTAEQEVAVAEAQIAALVAQLAQAQVAIETAQANLAYTRITAPSAGTVLAVVNQAGQTVNAVQSSPTIVVLGQLDRMAVHAKISEADIGKVGVGQKVRFHLLGDAARSYEAELQAIAPAPQSIVNDSAIDPDSASDSDTAAVYYTGIIPVDNADGHLRTYMTAQVSIVQGEARNVLTIPAVALGTRASDGSYPVRVLLGGGVRQRDVQIGLNDKVVAEVVSGLNEGDQVVTGEATVTTPQQSGCRPGGMMGPPPMGG
ncbi:efflux RND transporter periplasmic adaptor subunit [Paracoccus laeviglucosivorans]|uniref:Membrane fusion protein, macrolide-specific efflux system n=1 Tax=Paracoccus laeviglucosivorans TaxID=1197861 RepID=A0A521FA05_9RHOB|nr:efflux RND transporter periplasmic adaptor subunit [Paracoccus laeviglucosivorans]SMO93008.1 membrane fusion protein, macrolide-specific efflux system [Paracoccus laeviglucosivorans]